MYNNRGIFCKGENMKKFISLISAIMCVMVFGIILTACGEKPVEIAVKDDTLDTQLDIGENLVLDDLVLLVTYSNDKVKEVKYNDEMQFACSDNTPLDEIANEVGEKQVIIKYLGLQTEVTITVTESQHVPTVEYEVQSFGLPTFITDFENNAKAFNISDNTYKVGDDNSFELKPIIMGVEIVDGVRGDFQALDYVPATYKVEQKIDGEYVELTGEDLTETVTINQQKFGFDFADKAVGNTYRITVTAQTISGDVSISHELEVVDGFNIQSKEMLSVMDNNPTTQKYWADLKAQNNVPQVDTNSVVIHGSYELSDSDVPQAYYYKEGDSDYVPELANTMRNWKTIYHISVDQDETYKIYGNYNTIDASAIALTNLDYLNTNKIDNEKFGHASLFSFGIANNNHPTNQNQGSVVMDSLNLIGNTNRDESEALRGGLLMVLTGSKDVTLNNVNGNSWVTMLVSTTEGSDWETASTHISNCKFTDSYSLMINYWGIKNNYIEDSILSGSGGPVVFLTHLDPKDTPNSNYANVEVINSTVETTVSGEEAWFGLNDATRVATELKKSNQLFLGTSQALKDKGLLPSVRSLLDNDGLLNAAFVFVSNGNPVLNSNPVKGKVTIKNEAGEVTFVHDMEDQTFKATTSAPALAPYLENLPFFNAGGQLYTTYLTNQTPDGFGRDPITALDLTNMEERQKMVQFLSDEYVGIFVNGIPTMGAVVEYFSL